MYLSGGAPVSSIISNTELVGGEGGVEFGYNSYFIIELNLLGTKEKHTKKCYMSKFYISLVPLLYIHP